jgi:branched-chain amino acid transport system ATP-binding protein
MPEIRDLNACTARAICCMASTSTLLGRNGAGKSTTLKSIMGLVGQRTGSIRFQGEELIAGRSDRIARTGIAYCPLQKNIA